LIRRGLTRIAELRAAGVNLAFGQDCVRDGFYPFRRGDMLEVGLISAHAAHLSGREDLAYVLNAITAAPARAWRLSDYGIRPNARADLQLMTQTSWEEALRLQDPPQRVWFKGTPVAATERPCGASEALRRSPRRRIEAGRLGPTGAVRAPGCASAEFPSGVSWSNQASLFTTRRSFHPSVEGHESQFR